jgi:hypothetical protein
LAIISISCLSFSILALEKGSELMIREPLVRFLSKNSIITWSSQSEHIFLLLIWFKTCSMMGLPRSEATISYDGAVFSALLASNRGKMSLELFLVQTATDSPQNPVR